MSQVDADEAMANAERDLKADAEWKRIQQNTFTRWANEHLKQADKQVSFQKALFLLFQARIAHLVAYQLGTGEVPGSNPGKSKFFQ